MSRTSFAILALVATSCAAEPEFKPVPGYEKQFELRQPSDVKGTHQPAMGRTHYQDGLYAYSFSVRPLANDGEFTRFKKAAKSSESQRVTVLENDEKNPALRTYAIQQDLLDQGKVQISMFFFSVLHRFGEDYVSCTGMTSKSTLQKGLSACKSLKKK